MLMWESIGVWMNENHEAGKDLLSPKCRGRTLAETRGSLFRAQRIAMTLVANGVIVKSKPPLVDRQPVE